MSAGVSPGAFFGFEVGHFFDFRENPAAVRVQ
jgi:hypothetical protein